jgi:hypothetical protein
MIVKRNKTPVRNSDRAVVKRPPHSLVSNNKPWKSPARPPISKGKDTIGGYNSKNVTPEKAFNSSQNSKLITRSGIKQVKTPSKHVELSKDKDKYTHHLKTPRQ